MSQTAVAPLLRVRGLTKHFPVRGGVLNREKGRIRAVEDFSVDVERGRTLGLVGESGCGKSTAGRLILHLIEPDAGEVTFDGENLGTVDAARMRALRRDMQMIFQDPYASLNPRMTIREIVEEALIVHRLGTAKERLERIMEILKAVGLRPEMADRYPHEFSGGQRQRVGIARALVLEPKLIVADEPLSALDVSVQASAMNLMQEIQETFGVSFILIAHDLAAVEHLSDRVAVMYLGRIVEEADAETIYTDPKHPYTQMLLASVPSLDPRAERNWNRIQGEIPSPMNPPSGCAFRTRCPHAMDVCAQVIPKALQLPGNRRVACHLYTEPGVTSPAATPNRKDQT
jgi:oligopeptide transport system ATP-binding protein